MLLLLVRNTLLITTKKEKRSYTPRWKKRCEALEKKFTKRMDKMSKDIEVLEGRVQ